MEKQTEAHYFIERHLQQGSLFGLKIKSKIHEEKTPITHIEIFDTEHFGHLMVMDGCFMLTQYENFLYHEMMSHPALFTHPNAKRVLIIGGGDCGTLKEVLRHSTVESAVQVEIEERVTRLAEKYFPELCTSNQDPRAKLIFDDGIRWVKEAPDASIDLIIIDSTDPVGPAEGLFTESFYRECYRVLANPGILMQQTESPLYHQTLIQEVHLSLRQVGFSNTQLFHYPQPCYPSGWWSATMAGKNVSSLDFRKDDAEKKVFETKFYNADIHIAAQAIPEFFKTL